MVVVNRRHCIVALAAAGGVGLLHAAAAAAAGRKILVVGDSLSAEYGLRRGSGWVALLANRLKTEQPGVEVVNASISGDTTAGGRSRLAPLLAQHKPGIVVIELGGNDALRGLPLKSTEDNLNAMTEAATQAGARVLLVGMQIPPNYGSAYANQFNQVFENVARARKVGLVPFLLKGVADGADAMRMFQADGIHPKEDAHPIMLGNLWGELRKMLK